MDSRSYKTNGTSTSAQGPAGKEGGRGQARQASPRKQEASGSLSRRDVLKLGAATGAAATVAAVAASPVTASAKGGTRAAARTSGGSTSGGSCTGLQAIEAFPTSPLILQPFIDPLVVPKAAAPCTDDDVASWANKPGHGRPASRTATAARTSSGRAAGQRGRELSEQADHLPQQPPGGPPQLHLVAGPDARRLPRREGQADPGRHGRGEAPRQHHLRLQREVPRPHDQRGVREARMRSVRQPARPEPVQPGPTGLRRARLGLPHPPAQCAHRPGVRRQPAPQAGGVPAGRLGRQPLPQLPRRRGRAGEAVLLLVPRPPHGSHRRQRLQGHGRALPDLRSGPGPG